MVHDRFVFFIVTLFLGFVNISIAFRSFKYSSTDLTISSIVKSDQRIKTSSRTKPLAVSQDDEYIPPLDQEPPLKILLLVEPTPFNYISGYANRYKEMLKYLKKAGDEVMIVTPDKDRSHPDEFLGYSIYCPRGWEFPLYPDITLTFDFRGKIDKLIRDFKPDIIHASTPSAIQNPATLWAAVHNVPLLLSYHTDFPGYAKAYAKFPGSVAFAYWLLKLYHSPADLVLCTSPQLKADMQSVNINCIDVWRKGINTEVMLD